MISWISTLHTPSWSGIIDILFLTLVAYQLYSWFRGTRALRVLIGLLVFGGIYSLAQAWGLFLTTWVFQILWQVLLILLLILFQSEIRQVLEKVSPLRYLRFRKRHANGIAAEELAQMVFDLAAEKTGALIVIKRDENLSEFLLGGQPIMALPEPLLIKSIFNHHGPAHDGALVLARDRITRMGCILPLSKREDIPEKFGTRHRAAVGLSELTDAVCLVVSEERGEVTSAVKGIMEKWENPQALTARLMEWLAVPDIPRFSFLGLLRATFIKNWGAKLTALLLVTLAWFALSSQHDIKISVNAPIRYINMPATMVLEEASVQELRLTLSGSRHRLETLQARDIRVQVDVGAMPAGTHPIRLSEKNVELPIGITVDRVHPEMIVISLEGAEDRK